jgi:hypothetical protein
VIIHDLTGFQCGGVTVLGLAHASATGRTRWRCRCRCGEEGVLDSTQLHHRPASYLPCAGRHRQPSKGEWRWTPPPPRPPAPDVHAEDTLDELRAAIEQALEAQAHSGQAVRIVLPSGARLTVDEAAARVWALRRRTG